MPTRADAFRALRTQGTEITLPSCGLTVSLRPVSLPSLIRSGVVPSTLFAAAMRGFPELTAAQAAAEKAAETGETLDDALVEKWARMTLEAENLTFQWLKASLVSPRLVEVDDDPTADAITIDDIPDDDRAHILAIIQAPVREWSRFHVGQGAGVRAVDDVQGVRPPAE